MADLKGRIALVTGASRGVGRGVALGLAHAGATVYATGRTIADAELDSSITKLTCDHNDDQAVATVFQQIDEQAGQLDVLVNVAWGGYECMVEDGRFTWMAPFWEQSLHQWDGMFTAGVRAHLAASRLAVPLMLPQGRGLIVSTTANLAALPYLPNIFYDLSKHTISRLVWAMAHELRDRGIAVLAVAPGFMRTERVTEAFRRAGAIAALDGPGGPKETPVYLGRAIASPVCRATARPS